MLGILRWLSLSGKALDLRRPATHELFEGPITPSASILALTSARPKPRGEKGQGKGV